MSVQRILGIALLAAAVILVIVGLNASQSFVDQLSNAFTGRPTNDTMWFFIAAGIAGVLGLVLTFGRFGKR